MTKKEYVIWWGDKDRPHIVDADGEYGESFETCKKELLTVAEKRLAIAKAYLDHVNSLKEPK